MRKDVFDFADIFPISLHGRSAVIRRLLAPVTCRKAKHPAEKTFIRALFYQKMIPRPKNINKAIANRRWSFFLFSRKGCLLSTLMSGAPLRPRTIVARWIFRTAERCAQIHQSLPVIPWPLRPNHSSRQRAQGFAALWQAVFKSENSADNPLNIAVYNIRRFIGANSRDGGRSIGANTWQLEQRSFIRGKNAFILITYHPCTFMKVTRPRIIAKPGPHRQNSLTVCICESGYGWK